MGGLSSTQTTDLAIGDLENTDATRGVHESMVLADSTDSWSRMAGAISTATHGDTHRRPPAFGMHLFGLKPLFF